MTPAQNALEFDHVRFALPQRELLHDATFSLAPLSATALIGPNGVGKTTLLRLASGILRPSSGSIALFGQPLASLTVRDAARTVAVVPQQLEIPFEFTVEQVVEQGRTPFLSFFRGPSAADSRAVDRALDLTDTSRFRHRIFNELSGGERQRVKIALAVAQQPRLLLLDEPTQNLDIGRQAELLALLEHLRHNGMTLLAAMHELHLIPGAFSSVILLESGMPLRIGPPETLLQADVLSRAFQYAPALSSGAAARHHFPFGEHHP